MESTDVKCPKCGSIPDSRYPGYDKYHCNNCNIDYNGLGQIVSNDSSRVKL